MNTTTPKQRTHRHVEVPYKAWKQVEADRLGIPMHTLEMRLARKRHALPRHPVKRGPRIMSVRLPAHVAKEYLNSPARCGNCRQVLTPPDRTDCPHCLAIDTET